MDHKHTEILPDIIDSCRLCLKSDSNIRNIFCNNHLKWAETDISEQILQATTIKVSHISHLQFYGCLLTPIS